jgi:hypothetical protein
VSPELQGRDLFEGGERGADWDIERGMAGYEMGIAMRPYAGPTYIYMKFVREALRL